MIPALIVPVLAKYELLERMIASIDHPVGNLIVIDNGDELDCVGSRWAERVTLLNMPANLGVAGSWNLGIKCAPFASWWLIANFDVTWPPGSLARFAEEAERDTLLLGGGSPPWCAFALGDQVVERVGLFDERFHPAYFEDNDYTTRAETAGVRVEYGDIPVHHDNSSTVTAGFQQFNDRTFSANAEWYGRKIAAGDTSSSWELTRRRELTWD